MNIPSDPAILLSFINTKLRDFYPSFTSLCEDMELDADEVKNKLSLIGYSYNEARNQFV